MKRLVLAIAVLVTGCGSDAKQPDAAVHDAAHDALVDAAGSGSNAVASIEAHPRDHGLELLVVGLSVVVVAGPVRRSRRRRDDL